MYNEYIQADANIAIEDHKIQFLGKVQYRTDSIRVIILPNCYLDSMIFKINKIFPSSNYKNKGTPSYVIKKLFYSTVVIYDKEIKLFLC